MYSFNILSRKQPVVKWLNGEHCHWFLVCSVAVFSLTFALTEQQAEPTSVHKRELIFPKISTAKKSTEIQSLSTLWLWHSNQYGKYRQEFFFLYKYISNIEIEHSQNTNTHILIQLSKTHNYVHRKLVKSVG